MPTHLTPDFLYQISTGERDVADLAATALGHLLEICPSCSRAVEQWRQEGSEAKAAQIERSSRPSSSAPEALIRSSNVLDRLLQFPEAEWPETLGYSSAAYPARALAEELLDRIRALLPFQPAKVQKLASLACILLRHTTSTPENVALYALSLAHQANAARVQEEIVHARELMATARFILRGHEQLQREVDPLVLAEVDQLEGSLRRSQRLLDEAAFLHLRAMKTYMRHGCDLLGIQCLLSASGVYEIQGAYSRAERGLRLARKMLNRRQPTTKLLLLALHNRVYVLTRCNRPQEARRVFDEIQDLYREEYHPSLDLRRRWAHALILKGEGSPTKAEDELLQVREAFQAEDRLYCAAVVSKDLISLYTEQDRFAEVEETVEEMIPVFEAKEVSFEADAVRKILRDAGGSRREVN